MAKKAPKKLTKAQEGVQEGNRSPRRQANKVPKQLMDVADKTAAQEVYICLLGLDIALFAFCRHLVLPSWASSNFLGALHSLLVLTS